MSHVSLGMRAQIQMWSGTVFVASVVISASGVEIVDGIGDFGDRGHVDAAPAAVGNGEVGKPAKTQRARRHQTQLDHGWNYTKVRKQILCLRERYLKVFLREI